MRVNINNKVPFGSLKEGMKFKYNDEILEKIEPLDHDGCILNAKNMFNRIMYFPDETICEVYLYLLKRFQEIEDEETFVYNEIMYLKTNVPGSAVNLRTGIFLKTYFDDEDVVEAEIREVI
ncbi:MAG: hypothetical protein NC548_22700 [Lachnospiraceae bacterium]|nr:hypothetical protein [Lachnospiraceae bacterium]